MKKKTFLILSIILILITISFSIFANINLTQTYDEIENKITFKKNYNEWKQINEKSDNNLNISYNFINQNTFEINITNLGGASNKFVGVVCNNSGFDSINKYEYNPSTEIWSNTGALNYDNLAFYGMNSSWCDGYGFILFSSSAQDRRLRLEFPIAERELEVYLGDSKQNIIYDKFTVEEVKLINNTEICGQECYAYKNFTIYENSSLIDDVRFYKKIDDTWELSNIRGYDLEYWTEIPIYNYSDYSCDNFSCNYTQIGYYDGWKNYNLGEILPAGDYETRLKGYKRPSWTYDWQILTQGYWTEVWAIWGNISEGDEAEVILKYPEDNYFSLNASNNFTCFTNITNGARIVNSSLYFIDENGSLNINLTEYPYINNNGESDTTHNPDSFTNPENAFDSNDATYAEINTGQGAGDKVLGKTFSNRSIRNITIKATSYITTTNCDNDYINAYVYLQTYDGASWGNEVLLASDSGTGCSPQTASYDSTYELNSYVQGIRIRLKNQIYAGGPSTSGYLRLYTLEYETHPENYTKNFTQTIYNNKNWTCKSCDSDGACGFAEENRSITLDFPNFTINSPASSVLSASINIDADIFATGNLSYCYYNITRGASIEKSNEAINCSNFTDSYTLSGESTYSLNIWANQSGSISNSTSYPFTYSIPTPPASGGGGGGTVIISGEAGWTMEVADGISSYDKNIPKGTTKELTIDFENIGDSSRTLTLSCQDTKRDMCKYVTFEEKSFQLPLIKDVKLTKTFTIALPDEIETGEYQFNIIATDELGRSGSITANIATGNQGFILTTFSKLPNKTKGGIPYTLIFIPELILLSIIITNLFSKKVETRIILGFVISLIISLATVYLV